MKTLILSVSLFFSTLLMAGKISCVGSNQDGAYVCSWDKMKIYNQRIVSDMHCAPTSASMGLSTLTHAGVSYYLNSWTAKEFVNHSEKERIENFGKKMGTSDEDGTGIRSLQYRLRSIDLPSVSGSLRLPVFTKIDTSYMRSRILDRNVDILSYGHYTKNCKSYFGIKVCNFSRDGGHFIAINGYRYLDGNYTVQVYNPWNGVVQIRDFNSVPYESFTLRPYSFNTTTVYQDGNKYKIIDTLSGLKTN